MAPPLWRRLLGTSYRLCSPSETIDDDAVPLAKLHDPAGIKVSGQIKLPEFWPVRDAQWRLSVMSYA
ncbi:MAG: hypothetical protein HWN68_16130 [Desulfobacterales bacterium]|nr:hypothetical protein [Desulfobacterales bacterium]